MKVKICGIMTEEIALAASRAGADFLGFVFAKSKREISPEKAAEITRNLPSHIKTVGVFVNESIENMKRIATEARLDYIQLHGDESPEFCRKLSLPIIKAFSITTKNDLEKLKEYNCDYYLLDSPGVKYRGGSGLPFDWSLLKDSNIPKEKLILAGGLNVQNVKEAIGKVQPIMVDVSSGVETNGVKDKKKMNDFIKLVKEE